MCGTAVPAVSYLPTYLPTYSLTHLLTYLPTYLSTYQLTVQPKTRARLKNEVHRRQNTYIGGGKTRTSAEAKHVHRRHTTYIGDIPRTSATQHVHWLQDTYISMHITYIGGKKRTSAIKVDITLS